MPSIVQITEWPAHEIEELTRESEAEGFCFLARLRDEWRAGVNRFSNTGEALFGAFEGGKLLAVGGLNREADDCGRLRRFYVKRNARRQGLGRLLVQHILRFAREHYSRVVLRTDTEIADQFYVALGFTRLPPGKNATHLIEIVQGEMANQT